MEAFFLPAHQRSSDYTQRLKDTGDLNRKMDAVTVKGKSDGRILALKNRR